MAWMFASSGRGLLAGVLEVDGPFHDREIGVLDGQATHFQAGLGLGPGEHVLRAAVRKLAAFLCPVPVFRACSAGRQERAGRLTAVIERKGRRHDRLSDLIQQMVDEPAVSFPHFRGPRNFGRAANAWARRLAKKDRKQTG